MIRALHHVQLAMPPGGEDEARRFFVGTLGMAELDKPPELSARGGCWFASGGAEVHVGAESDFRPARKAHPALAVDDLDALRTRFERAGVTCTDDERVAGYRRFYATDPFGNRLEFVQASQRAGLV